MLSICDIMSKGSSSLLSRAFILRSIQCLPISLILRIAVAYFCPANGTYYKSVKFQHTEDISTEFTINQLTSINGFWLTTLNPSKAVFSKLTSPSSPAMERTTGSLSKSAPKATYISIMYDHGPICMSLI